MSTMGCKARTSMEKQATRSIFERKRLAYISLREAFAIAISDAIKKNPQWVLTNQGSELSGCIYQ
ncbi:MAG: hypothetical protein RMY64_12130 [Nostoc sp. DedQUE08]|nr:hypothetical protein [Nostoc sp. DedSLP04]MDZ8066369.1 hypothetical protein [Nostoc sp. DedQUE08]